MRLTIIVPDNAVGIDGVFYDVALGGLVPQHLHALQWYGDSGEEEYKEPGQPPRNVIIESLSTYQPVIDAWHAAHDAVMNPPPAPLPSLEDAKAQRIDDIKAEAYEQLAPTDWYVIRQQETGEPIPAAVSDYRAAVRAAAEAAEAEVSELDDPATVVAYVVEWPVAP